MKKIINRHWREGGTGVTNFSENERYLYEKVVRQYGAPDFVVTKDPMPPMSPSTGGALHYLGDKMDLSDFWKYFRSVERNDER